MTIAALYIDPRGPYPRMANGAVDCWDASRDARQYAGGWPVVAHPPCKHWSRLRHLAHVECLGEVYTAKGGKRACGWRGRRCDRLMNHIGNDGYSKCPRCNSMAYTSDADCAPRAVAQVRRWGGVLEHPAGSELWAHCGLPEPGDTEIVDDGRTAGLFPRYTIEVDQCSWGHVARKRTWLYLVGVPREALEEPPFPGREPTHWISGGRGRSGKRNHTPVPPGIKVASAQLRRRTPPLFAEYLVRLARSTRR